MPTNLALTPYSIASWFWDDGSLCAKDRAVMFYTDSFTLQECNYLIDQLFRFNIHAYTSKRAHKENTYLIKINSRSFLDFIDLINIDVPSCMNYKVDLKEYPERYQKLLSKETVLEIIKQIKDGKPQHQIVKDLNVSEYVVTNIYRGKRHWKLSGFNQLPKSQPAYNNTSGISGVHKNGNVYVARIGLGKKNRIFLGQFKNFEDAIKIRLAAENLRKQGIKDVAVYNALNQTKFAF